MPITPSEESQRKITKNKQLRWDRIKRSVRENIIFQKKQPLQQKQTLL